MNNKFTIFICLTLIFFLSCLIINTCSSSSDSNDQDNSINLTASWQITRTITANTFGLSNGETNTEVLYLEDTNGSFTITNFDGIWGDGSRSGKNIQFTGSETSNDFGMPAILFTQGNGTVNDSTIGGNFITEVYISNDVGSGNPDGTIDFEFVMLKIEESSCYDRAIFGDPQNSHYILPYPVGKSYPIYQSYCWRTGGHRNQLAYDFTIPIGDTIIAARSGIVREIREDSPDNGEGDGQHNRIFIEHDDGTAAFYAHLMQNSIVVEVNESVQQGQFIARSGNSGQSGEPHLHLGVYQSYPATEGIDIPFNFSNTQGSLDSANGLIRGQVYLALPF